MLLSGKIIAEQIQYEIKEKLHGRTPHLAVILVGYHPPSHTYVSVKKRACKEVGIVSIVHQFPENVSERELLSHIQMLNCDNKIDGILIQLPLPSHINSEKVMESVDPRKDIDGFHPLNMGKLLLGIKGGFIPCTPLGIKVLLDRYAIKLPGKHVVIVGRSNIVGKPLATLLAQKDNNCNATVTLAHSQTHNLSMITRTDDILVAALGSPHFIKKDMVKEGAVVIDVGINRQEDPRLPKGYRIVGDVDFEAVKKIASAITPVPGGIGPMTVAMLLNNTYLSFERKQ
jgi:methylenetetrahydrofolate dehydrogenase (NADP+) / methenyltetrahydrofolate cyclohydrolase